MIGDARSHAGRHSDRSVHSREVVPSYPEGHTSPVIRQLAAVGIRPAHEPAEMCSHAQIESFHVRCTYETRLGLSAPDTWDRPRNPARGTKPVGAGHVRGRNTI